MAAVTAVLFLVSIHNIAALSTLLLYSIGVYIHILHIRIGIMVEKIFEKSRPNIFNGNLEYWMTHLPPYLKTLPIIHLAIPGSHDTMTYTIDRRNEVGPDESIYIRLLGRYCPFISKRIIYNWCVTQYENITEQLNGGIRYLDLRLATKPGKEAIYFLHGLYGSEVTEPLEHVERWLTSHPEEFVILDCQHFYSFTTADHRYFVDKMKRIFGQKICPVRRNLNEINLRWLKETNYQILIVYRNEIARIEADVWPSGAWPTPWPNTVQPERLIDFLNVRLRSRIADIGFVSQCLLTPNISYVLKHLCGSLHKDLADVCRRVSLPWIREQKPGNAGLNVVITDYVAHDDFLFCRTVVERNNELLKNPQLAAILPKY